MYMYRGEYIGDHDRVIGAIKGETRNLDYSSHGSPGGRQKRAADSGEVVEEDSSADKA